jgi:hypothetical protein
MAIDFLGGDCSSYSSSQVFGLKDDMPNVPARITEDTADLWVAVVHNPSEHNAQFIGVDNCVEVIRENGEEESRCDGILVADGNLVFVELKTGLSRGWFGEGLAQIEATMRVFFQNHHRSDFRVVRAQVCNSSHPRSAVGRASTLEAFFDRTGILVDDAQEIWI